MATRKSAGHARQHLPSRALGSRAASGRAPTGAGDVLCAPSRRARRSVPDEHARLARPHSCATASSSVPGRVNASAWPTAPKSRRRSRLCAMTGGAFGDAELARLMSWSEATSSALCRRSEDHRTVVRSATWSSGAGRGLERPGVPVGTVKSRSSARAAPCAAAVEYAPKETNVGPWLTAGSIPWLATASWNLPRAGCGPPLQLPDLLPASSQPRELTKRLRKDSRPAAPDELGQPSRRDEGAPPVPRRPMANQRRCSSRLGRARS